MITVKAALGSDLLLLINELNRDTAASVGSKSDNVEELRISFVLDFFVSTSCESVRNNR